MNFPPSVPLLYPLLVSCGILLAVCYPVTKQMTDPRLKRQYYVLQAVALLGLVVGAKLAVMWGDHDWPFTPMSFNEVLVCGRSITGGLIGGFLAPEVAKVLIGYPMPPNDRFAAILPFSIAIGRVGCLLDGCCRGIPWNGPWSIVYGDGIPRHPAQIYEILFQLSMGVLFLYLVNHGLLFGRIFCAYLFGYGCFRFLTEFLRETPRIVHGFSAYQVMAVFMLLLGLGVLLKRTLYPPATWEPFRVAWTLF